MGRKDDQGKEGRRWEGWLKMGRINEDGKEG